jgi:branched-chain amino acid transport system permease protein
MNAAAVENFLQLFAAGLTLGCVYGLMCVGLALIFGVMRVINFAQGDFMMLGMYFVLLVTGYVATEGTAGAFYFAMLASLFAGLIFYGLGALTHRLLIGRVTGTRVAEMEDEGHTPQLLVTLGLSLVLQNVALMFFNSTPRAIRNPFSSESWQLPVWGNEVIVFLNQARTVAALVAVAIAVALAIVMKRTGLGRRLRAAADNSVAATYVGVNVNKAHRVAFGLGIGIALTTIAGATAATFHTFHPFTGLEFVIIMYAGVVLGGMGSIAGAFFGGLVIGLVQQMSTLVLPVQLQMTAIFVVFLLILIFRPQGFFGRQVERA